MKSTYLLYRTFRSASKNSNFVLKSSKRVRKCAHFWGCHCPAWCLTHTKLPPQQEQRCCAVILHTARWLSQVPTVEADSPFTQFNTLSSTRVPLNTFLPLSIYLHRSRRWTICSITQCKTIGGQTASFSAAERAMRWATSYSPLS